MAKQKHGPAVVLAQMGRYRCQWGRELWPKEEGLALHICRPLQLCDRPEAPTCLPDCRALLQPVLRAHQVDPGWEHMAQVSEQARPQWETSCGPGWCFHVGKWEDSRWGNSQVGHLSLNSDMHATVRRHASRVTHRFAILKTVLQICAEEQLSCFAAPCSFFPYHTYMCKYSLLMWIWSRMSTVQYAKPPVLIVAFYFKVWTRVTSNGDSQMSKNILRDFSWTTGSRLGSCDGKEGFQSLEAAYS